MEIKIVPLWGRNFKRQFVKRSVNKTASSAVDWTSVQRFRIKHCSAAVHNYNFRWRFCRRQRGRYSESQLWVFRKEKCTYRLFYTHLNSLATRRQSTSQACVMLTAIEGINKCLFSAIGLHLLAHGWIERNWLRKRLLGFETCSAVRASLVRWRRQYDCPERFCTKGWSWWRKREDLGRLEMRRKAICGVVDTSVA